jgi:hypothetical protein
VKSFRSMRGCIANTVVLSLSAGLLLSRAIAASPEVPSPGEQKTVPLPSTEKVERENWHRTLLQRRPKTTSECFAAIFPETEWRPVPCNTPPDKLYLPRQRGSRGEFVGGTVDSTAEVTGHISEAVGSFDSVTGVTSESNSAGTPNAYSLQINTEPLKTSTCATSPGGVNGTCRGWQQFVYTSSGNGFIQYWLLNYGPRGTSCPTPRGAHCSAGGVFTDGWCPYSPPGQTEVYCVINAVRSAPAPAEPITALQRLKVQGFAARPGVNAVDSIFVSTGSTVNLAPGNNYFPDLINQWQTAEFNVFGDANGDQAVFNQGSTLVVRTIVDDGVNLFAPVCVQQSFTAETNNLTLVESPALVAENGPAIVFTESNAAGATTPSCTTSPTGQWLVPLMGFILGK